MICLNKDELKEVLQEFFNEFERQKHSDLPDYISRKEAMKLFKVTSATTLKKYVDFNEIKIKKISKTKVLYSRKSILDFLSKDN